MVFEVSSRYLFNSPTIWAFELSWMLMGAIFIMGISYAMKRRDHVAVDLIYAELSPRKRAFVDTAGFAMLLPPMAWTTYRMFDYALSAFRSGEVSGISAWNPVVWPFRTILFVGLAVFTLQIVAELLRSLSQLFGAAEGGVAK
jgi:TRAP-type mannitol/chloroaromatic compound transport system permease small subunit